MLNFSAPIADNITIVTTNISDRGFLSNNRVNPDIAFDM